MTATTPAAFDPEMIAGHRTVDVIATSAILAGQFVAFNSTGVDWTVEPANGVTTPGAFGVAMYSAAAGAHLSVAIMGSVVKVCEGAGSDIDAGDLLSIGGALGCVITCVDSADHAAVGVALEDITKNLTGYTLLTAPCWVAKGA